MSGGILSILRLAGVKYLKVCFKVVFEGEGEGVELKGES